MKTRTGIQHPVVALVGAIVLALWVVPVFEPWDVASPTEVESAARRYEFSDFLAGMDLVVEGDLVRADTVTHFTLGGCGSMRPDALKATQYRIRASDVIVGTAEESTLVINALGWEQWPTGWLEPGVHVLAWGARNCADRWRFWGGALVVTADGRLLSSRQMAADIRLSGAPLHEPQMRMLLDSLLEARKQVFSTRAFLGKHGIALVRLGEYSSNEDIRRYRYTCDSLGWVMKSTGAFPRSIEFDRAPGCVPDLGPGDTLIVPVAANDLRTELTFTHCPRGWKVQDSYVVGFGVRLDHLSYAIERQPSGLAPRSFLEEQ